MPPAMSSQSPNDHLLIVDSTGACRWASTALVHALGFDPRSGSSLRLHPGASDGQGSNLTGRLREDVLVRVESPKGRRRWLAASGIRIRVDSGEPFWLLRLSEAELDGLARTAFALASHRDTATLLLTPRGLAARLAHPASALVGQAAVALLQVSIAGDTPWGPSLGQRDSLIGAMARVVHQAGGQVRFVARMAVDELGVVVDGLRSRNEVLPACERLRRTVTDSLADSFDWGGANVVLAEVLVPNPALPNESLDWPWRPTSKDEFSQRVAPTDGGNPAFPSRWRE